MLFCFSVDDSVYYLRGGTFVCFDYDLRLDRLYNTCGCHKDAKWKVRKEKDTVLGYF